MASLTDTPSSVAADAGTDSGDILSALLRRLRTSRLWPLPWHHVLLLAWAARWYTTMLPNGGLSWHFFAAAGRLFVGEHWHGYGAPGGLRLFADYPRLQFGPVTFAVAAVMRLLGPDQGRIAALTLMAAVGPVLLWLLERTARQARPELTADQIRWTVLGGGAAFLPLWMVLAVQFAHLDDVLALLFAALAVRALVRGNALLLGVFVALSGGAKPWAFVILPLVVAVGPRSRRRAITAVLLVTAALWAPFVLTDPGSVAAAKFTIPNVRASGLRALGVDDARTPSWDRPAQILAGCALAGLAVARRRWPAVVILGCAVRIALDPNTYVYYSAGVVLGALIWDLMGARRTAPLWSMISMTMLIAETSIGHQAAIGGDVRICFVLFAGVALIFGPAGRPRVRRDAARPLAAARRDPAAAVGAPGAGRVIRRLERHPRWYGALAGLLVLGVTAGVLAVPGRSRPPVRPLLLAGIAADPDGSGVLPVPVGQTGTYLPDSSVLRTRGGLFGAAGARRAAAGTAPASVVAVTGTRQTAAAAWLSAGTVPGTTAASRGMAERALLDLRLSVLPGGAVVAGWVSGWEYCWPRDASFTAAALAVTGHGSDALSILRYLARVQLSNGTWLPRYATGVGAAKTVPAPRQEQLDDNGWVPWAVWFWYAEQPATGAGHAAAAKALAGLWPSTRRAADAAAASLGADGLPRASSDYWERQQPQQTVETAAALGVGLRSAADLAMSAGDRADARRWSAAGARLDAAITRTFGATGYRRTPSAGSGADAAVTMLGPPFAPADPRVGAAVRRSLRQLTLPDGGVLPGSDWMGNLTAAWTPETGFFALYDAASGDRTGAARLVAWLAAHRTGLGALPEQVDARGRPASVAPLAWTDSIVLLTLAAQSRPLPTPPA